MIYIFFILILYKNNLYSIIVIIIRTNTKNEITKIN